MMDLLKTFGIPILLAVLAFLGLKGRSGFLNNKSEKKEQEKEDIQKEIEKEQQEVEETQEKVEQIKQEVADKRKETQKKEEIVKEEKEKTDNLEEGEDEKSNHDINSALNILNDTIDKRNSE
jgi:predicted nuclease with TOPRIM domain